MGLATREAYGKALAEIIVSNDKIVVLDADLTKSTKTADAKVVCPERHFNMGIAEGNMMSVAAGFAASGFTVFASTFAIFASGRAWEQIRNSIGYPHLNVKVCGTHAGISVGEDGASHQALEDIALMRVIPGMEVYQPCDGCETDAIIKYVATTKNPTYVRLGRSKVEDVYKCATEFEVGKISTLRKGSKIAIFATGALVQESLKAYEILKNEGIEVTVVNVSCLKPLDVQGVVEVFNNHDVIISAEEHNVMGGLGSILAEVSVKTTLRPIHMMGMNDTFGESGPAEKLFEKYGLTSNDIVKKVKTILG